MARALITRRVGGLLIALILTGAIYLCAAYILEADSTRGWWMSKPQFDQVTVGLAMMITFECLAAVNTMQGTWIWGALAWAGAAFTFYEPINECTRCNIGGWCDVIDLFDVFVGTPVPQTVLAFAGIAWAFTKSPSGSFARQKPGAFTFLLLTLSLFFTTIGYIVHPLNFALMGPYVLVGLLIRYPRESHEPRNGAPA